MLNIKWWWRNIPSLHYWYLNQLISIILQNSSPAETLSPRKLIFLIVYLIKWDNYPGKMDLQIITSLQTRTCIQTWEGCMAKQFPFSWLVTFMQVTNSYTCYAYTDNLCNLYWVALLMTKRWKSSMKKLHQLVWLKVYTSLCKLLQAVTNACKLLQVHASRWPNKTYV